MQNFIPLYFSVCFSHTAFVHAAAIDVCIMRNQPKFQMWDVAIGGRLRNIGFWTRALIDSKRFLFWPKSLTSCGRQASRQTICVTWNSSYVVVPANVFSKRNDIFAHFLTEKTSWPKCIPMKIVRSRKMRSYCTQGEWEKGADNFCRCTAQLAGALP